MKSKIIILLVFFFASYSFPEEKVETKNVAVSDTSIVKVKTRDADANKTNWSKIKDLFM